MDSIFTVRNMVTKECFMASIDLRDACLHIPIAPQSQKFLRVAVNMGKEVLRLQFRALPFGLSSAPRVFTKVMAEALTPVHLQGIAVIPYLDDLLFFAPFREKLQEDLGKARSHLESLGWIANIQKSNFNPAPQVQFLWYLINLVEQRIFLPEEEKIKVQNVTILQMNQQMSVKKVMSALETLTSTMPAIQWASLHFRPLQRFLLKVWNHRTETLDTRVKIPTRVKRTLWWWKNQSVLQKRSTLVLPDRKNCDKRRQYVGMGAHMGQDLAQGTWSQTEAEKSSNWRELKAVVLALGAFSPNLLGFHVQILLDNATTVAYLNKRGGTRSKTLTVRKNCGVGRKPFTVHLKGILNEVTYFF